MMRACGNTDSCVKTMYRPLSKDKPGFPNPHGKPLATLARQMHIHQLYPGDNLDFLEQQFLDWVEPRLTLDALKRECPYAIQSDLPTAKKNDGIVLPLMQWCSDYFTRAGQRAYFGPALDGIDPKLPQTFIVFDELSWQVLYQYPDFLAGEMKSARNAIQRALKKYIQLPQETRQGDAWFTKAMENEMRALGISEDDIATMLVTIYWGYDSPCSTCDCIPEADSLGSTPTRVKQRSGYSPTSSITALSTTSTSSAKRRSLPSRLTSQSPTWTTYTTTALTSTPCGTKRSVSPRTLRPCASLRPTPSSAARSCARETD